MRVRAIEAYKTVRFGSNRALWLFELDIGLRTKALEHLCKVNLLLDSSCSSLSAFSLAWLNRWIVVTALARKHSSTSLEKPQVCESPNER